MKQKKLNLRIQSINILDLENQTSLIAGKRRSLRRRRTCPSRAEEVAGNEG